MKMIHRLFLCAILAAAGAGGAGCSSLREPVPMNDAQLRTFFANARDPRRYWITVYNSDQGPVFEGGNRLHPEQMAELKMSSKQEPVVFMDTVVQKKHPVLIDTSSEECWATPALAQEFGMKPLGPPAYERKPESAVDNISGYLSVADTVIFDQLHIETALFYVRAATGPLGAPGRYEKPPGPAGVIGWSMLKAFRYVHIDFPGRMVYISSSFPYKPGAKLVASAPLEDAEGVFACSGMIDQWKTPVILDTAGDYELAMPDPPADPVRQVSIGDLVFRQVRAVSSSERNLGRRDYPRIGRQLLARFKITFEPSQKRVYFEKP